MDQDQDKEFWLALYNIMKDYIYSNRQFFQLDDEVTSPVRIGDN